MFWSHESVFTAYITQLATVINTWFHLHRQTFLKRAAGARRGRPLSFNCVNFNLILVVQLNLILNKFT